MKQNIKQILILVLLVSFNSFAYYDIGMIRAVFKKIVPNDWTIEIDHRLKYRIIDIDVFADNQSTINRIAKKYNFDITRDHKNKVISINMNGTTYNQFGVIKKDLPTLSPTIKLEKTPPERSKMVIINKPEDKNTEALTISEKVDQSTNTKSKAKAKGDNDDDVTLFTAISDIFVSIETGLDNLTGSTTGISEKIDGMTEDMQVINSNILLGTEKLKKEHNNSDDKFNQIPIIIKKEIGHVLTNLESTPQEHKDINFSVINANTTTLDAIKKTSTATLDTINQSNNITLNAIKKTSTATLDTINQNTDLTLITINKSTDKTIATLNEFKNSSINTTQHNDTEIKGLKAFFPKIIESLSETKVQIDNFQNKIAADKVELIRLVGNINEAVEVYGDAVTSEEEHDDLIDSIDGYTEEINKKVTDYENKIEILLTKAINVTQRNVTTTQLLERNITKLFQDTFMDITKIKENLNLERRKILDYIKVTITRLGKNHSAITKYSNRVQEILSDVLQEFSNLEINNKKLDKKITLLQENHDKVMKGLDALQENQNDRLATILSSVNNNRIQLNSNNDKVLLEMEKLESYLILQKEEIDRVKMRNQLLKDKQHNPDAAIQSLINMLFDIESTTGILITNKMREKGELREINIHIDEIKLKFSTISGYSVIRNKDIGLTFNRHGVVKIKGIRGTKAVKYMINKWYHEVFKLTLGVKGSEFIINERSVEVTFTKLPPSSKYQIDLRNTGMGVYNKYCYTCHESNWHGARSKNDTEFWDGYEDLHGFDNIYNSVVSGVGYMPAKGLCKDCSSDEISLAIKYLIKNDQ